MGDPTDSLAALLTVLRRYRVRFIVVGGVAAVIEGAPVATFDLDIVPERTRPNIDRLIIALRELGAYYRGRPGGRIAPRADDLRGVGHHLLSTRYGPLDVLGIIGKGWEFAALAPHARRRKIDRHYVLVLDLATQIAVKQEVGHRKDLLVIPLLEAALALRSRPRDR